MTAREHAEKATQLMEAADRLRERGYTLRRDRGNGEDVAAVFKDSGRQERAACAHATVALALAATDVTTGNAKIQRRLV